MSTPVSPGIRFAKLSHVGMRRANNQDSLAVMIAESEERFHRRGHLFVVADGMGAHAAGELASKIASERIATHYYCCDQTSPDLAVVEAVQQANTSIFDRGRSNPEFHNMGTTASTLVLVDGQALVAHVGDSRIYRLRGGVLEQLTFDHSLVWEMHASGQIHSDSPLGKSIPKNVITRSLGPAGEVTVDLEGPFDLQLSDRYLLCSDGLTGQVTDQELGTILGCVDIDKAVELLVDLANLRGGPDNTTVIVVDISESRMLSSGDTAGAGMKRGSLKPASSVDGPSRALLATMLFCWAGCLGFIIAAILVSPRYTGSAIVAFVLGAIAAGVWASGLLSPPKRRRSKTTASGFRGAAAMSDHASSPVSMGPGGEFAHGTGPYRHYNVQPTHEVYDKLRLLVEDLKDNARRKRWSLDWTDVDACCQDASSAAAAKDFRAAIERQGDAVLASMEQIRRHQDDEAGDTAVDL